MFQKTLMYVSNCLFRYMEFWNSSKFDHNTKTMFWFLLCLDAIYVFMSSIFSMFCCFLCFDVFYVFYVLMFSMFWCFLCLYLRKKVWRSTNKILPCLFHWHSEKTLPQKQCIVFVHNKKVTFIIQIMWP